jgi:hypothetical protein
LTVPHWDLFGLCFGCLACACYSARRAGHALADARKVARAEAQAQVDAAFLPVARRLEALASAQGRINGEVRRLIRAIDALDADPDDATRRTYDALLKGSFPLDDDADQAEAN